MQDDGTWLQEAWKLDPAWPQSLPGIAHANEQLYIPSMGNDTDGILIVLDSSALQQAAATNLVALATAGRFDSPWDGVHLDLEGIPSAYKNKLSDFLRVLSDAIRGAGLTCAISVRGKVSDPGPDYDSAYSYDFSILDEVADYVDLRLYGFWKPLDDPYQDKSVGPYWWLSDCIDYALSQGIPANKLFLAYGTFAMYYPDSAAIDSSSPTYAQALTLCNDNATYLGWVETGAYGRVREKKAILGAGHAWAHDADVARHAMGLITDNALGGLAYYIPGMEDDATWTAISDWRTGVVPWHGYIAVENLDLAAGQFTALLAIIKGQGRLSDRQPAYITHSRTVSAAITVTEAVFRYGEMTEDQCIQWLAAVLEVDPTGVTLAEAGDVWTLTHDGTDYVTIELFGGLDSDWATSGAACRAYLAG